MAEVAQNKKRNINDNSDMEEQLQQSQSKRARKKQRRKERARDKILQEYNISYDENKEEKEEKEEIEDGESYLGEAATMFEEPSNPFGPDMEKYWVQRYRFFSKYDEGIIMDEEAFYSVTPEKIAVHIANRCAGKVIIDGFCGVGGNSIQFAMTCDKVIAIDIDEKKIEMAKHNARIYGVEDKIEFMLGDYMKLAPTLKADVVFLSPPWGGPAYLQTELFDLKSMTPDGFDIFEATRKITRDIAYFLPRNTDPEQLKQLATNNNNTSNNKTINNNNNDNNNDNTCEVEQHYLNEKLKAITVYFGNLIK